MKLLRDEMVRTGDEQPLTLFEQGIRSDETKERYVSALRLITGEFLDDMLEGTFEERVSQLVRHGRDDPDWLLDLMLNLSRKLRERTQLGRAHSDYFNPASFCNYFSPLKKLFDMNGVAIPWKRVYATYPELDNMPDTAGWTRGEIAKILKRARDPMDRAIVLLLASSGVRFGALDQFNWGDLTPVYHADGKLTLDPGETGGELACAALEVYRGSSENYTTFITPEAFEALQDYGRAWSEAMGRQAKPEDPIFLRMRGVPRRISRGSLQRRMIIMQTESGLRKGAVQNQGYRVPLMNGFRRFFNKTCKDVGSGDSVGTLIRTEYLMGHKGLTTLDQNYFKTTTLELATDYVRVVPDLTINDEDRLRLTNKRLRENIQKADGEKDEVLAGMKEEMVRLKEEAERREAEAVAREKEKDEKMVRMEKEIVELRSSRGHPGMDLVDALKNAAGAEAVPGPVVESLTGMMRQLKESQEASFKEFRKTAFKELREEHDAEMAELRRELDLERRKSVG